MSNKNMSMIEVPFCGTIVDGKNTSWLGINSKLNLSAEKFEYFESVSGTVELYGFGNTAIGYALWYSVRIVLDKENTQKVNQMLKLNFNDSDQVSDAIYDKFGDGGEMTTTGLFDYLMEKFDILKEKYDEICEAFGLTERAQEQKVMLEFNDSYVEVEIDSLPKVENNYKGEQQLLKILSFFDFHNIDYKLHLCCIKND